MAQKVAEEKAAADQASAPGAKPKSGKLVLIVGLVTLIIVAQAIITYVLMPKAQDPKPEDAQAAAAKAAPAGDPAGDEGKDAPENETAEVAVGDFNCTNSTAAEGMVMHITFKLVAVASGAQAKALEDQLKSKNAQVRQLVNRIVRSSKMEDLDDPNMGTIKRLIRQEVNKLLRKSYIIEVVISDITTMQQWRASAMADDKDDLLNPEEIEALLNSGGPMGAPKGNPTGGAARSAPKPAGGLKDILNSNDIESLLQQRDRSGPLNGLEGTEELLNRAEADLAAAISPDLERSRASASRLAAAKPFEFEQFGSSGEGTDHLALTALQEVELDLRIELGRTELLIEEVLKLREGSVVPLDKLAGDPVDILVNGRLIARGEVLVLNDNFCVRVAEILTPDFP